MGYNGRKAGEDDNIDALLMSSDPDDRERAYVLIDTHYRSRIFAFSIVLGLRFGRWYSADDAYQDTILTFMRKVDNGDYEAQGHVGAYLHRITWFVVANQGRRIRRDCAVDIETLQNVTVDAVDPFKLDGFTQAFWDALDKLTPEEWTVYTKWLDLFDDRGNAPSLSRLIAALYKSPKDKAEETRQKDRARKHRDNAREKVRTHLLALGYEL